MFSVLLSLYYKENPKNLSIALDSIIFQTNKPNEIIIVEDGPLNKELYDILNDFQSKYNKIKRIRLNENVGLGKALNEGLKHCSYDLVARMDTDDISFPNRFEKQAKFMNEHPEIDACSAWIVEFINSTDNIISIKKLPETHSELLQYAKHRCPLNHPVVMYRKSAVLAAGGYHGFPEDYNLWVRMLMNGSKMHNLQESLLFFRYSHDMIKRRGGWKYAKEDFRSQKAFYQMGFIQFSDFIYNIAIRLTVRLIPYWLRDYIYKKGLRK